MVPDSWKNESFNYGLMVWSKDYSEWHVSMVDKPRLLSAYEGLYPKINFREVMTNEVEDWIAFFLNRADKTVEYWIERMYRGINQASKPAPICSDSIEEAVISIRKIFLE